MKKGILLFAGLLLLARFANAQLLEGGDFTGTGPITTFEKSGDSGFGLDSVYRTVDPKNASNQVMGLHFTFSGSIADTVTNLHARFDYGKIGNATYITAPKAQYVMFWVYIDSAANIPDSLGITTYAMDNKNWKWHDYITMAKDIPKSVWFPMAFSLGLWHAQEPLFDYITGGFMTGMQFQPQLDTAKHVRASSRWTGTIYVDNVMLVGVNPTLLEDGTFSGTGPITSFEKSSDSGFGLDSLFRTDDPTNASNKVMGLHFTFNSPIADTTLNLHARFEYGKIGAATYITAPNAKFVQFWVYIDSAQHIPDSLGITTYAMDNKNWKWHDYVTMAKDLPKSVWFPMAFPLMRWHAEQPLFDNITGGFMTGMQFQPQLDTAKHVRAESKWNGTIYIDDIELLDEVVFIPPVWHAATFEDGNKHGFYVPPLGCAKLTVIPDNVTSNGSMILQAAADLSQLSHRMTVQRDSVPMRSGTPDSSATSVTLDIFLPSNIPVGGVVKFYVSGGTGDSVSVVDTIASADRGKWTTLAITKLDSLAGIAQFDPTKKARVAVVLTYPGDTCTWKGNIWLDNLTVNGVGFPAELGNIVTGVSNPNVVKVFRLYNNYPNPFNPSTMIKYDIPTQTKVVMQVYDILGRQVETLVNEVKTPGSYEVQFNASRCASGVYFVRMVAGSYVRAEKMLLLK